MVNQLLAMARAEDQGQEAQRQTVNLARLATETVRDFVPRALEKRIDLGYEGPETGRGAPTRRAPWSPAHALLLRELIRNLVDNALQYTPAGGTVTVRIVDDPFGQVVVLQVEDSGPGHPGGRAREGVPALLPHARHRRRRQRPGPGHRARDRRSSTARRSSSRTPTCAIARG